MSFGFSVGDFLAVGQLVFKISASLNESTGSSAQYKELLLQFHCFKQLLNTVHNHIASSQFPPSAVRAITEHISQCKPLLRKFDTTTEKYKRTLSKKYSGNSIKDAWMKLG